MLDYLQYMATVYIFDFYKNYIYFFSCILLLFLLTKTARHTGLVDHPNARSSHSVPTPSGGGLAIVAIILASNLGLAAQCPEFFFGGLLIALVGLKDDIKPMTVTPRLVSQLLVVGAAVWLLPASAPIKGIPMPVIKIVLVLAGVWFINIYNFMDGIDGLAGGYANAAALGFLYCIKDTIMVEPWSLKIYAQLISVTMPFLIFNWNPAKIFMGDTGSTFIGFVFFCLGIRGLIFGNFIMWSFIIIMSFFWIDATITLGRRFFRGCQVFKAHKEHAFHKAAAIFGHWKVSCFIICVTLFWLDPMARVAVRYTNQAPLIALAAVLPILVIVLAFRPGFPIDQPGHLLKFLIKHFKNSSSS
jgi:Fuc2NAc and GlcNAc transferase